MLSVRLSRMRNTNGWSARNSTGSSCAGLAAARIAIGRGRGCLGSFFVHVDERLVNHGGNEQQYDELSRGKVVIE